MTIDVRMKSGLRALVVAVPALLLAGLAQAAEGEDGGPLPEGDPALGERLYMEGVTAAGEPVKAVTKGDIPVSGRQFSCVNCHRPSGFGSSEGGVYVPPITGPSLFNPTRFNRGKRNERFKEMFKEDQPPEFWSRVRQARARPAYTPESLAKVLRQGVDPEGRELDSIMPRYRLSDRDVANLVAFLRSLSAEHSPGVGAEKIHFATVVTEQGNADKRAAVLTTLRTFFNWMNKDTSSDQRFPNFSPYYRSEFLHAYRIWDLHVWKLSGPADTWPKQLAEYYAEQPVFGVVSGYVEGPWRPVADFCDAKEMPCIFPNIDLPRTENAEGQYSIYFSRGLELEGEALAAYLSEQSEPPDRVVQLRAAGPYGEVPATAFEAAAAEALPQADIETRTYADAAGLKAALAAIAEDATIDRLVIWSNPDTRPVVAALNETRPQAGRIVLPSMALEAAKALLDEALRDKVRLTHRYELPTAYHPRQYRVRAWFHTRDIGLPEPRVQLQTYYALTMVQYSLVHMISDFHRDYMIEIIEHEAENELNTGTHPKLALGPGQRFASKGSYIVALDAEAKGGFKAVSDWIVP